VVFQAAWIPTLIGRRPTNTGGPRVATKRERKVDGGSDAPVNSHSRPARVVVTPLDRTNARGAGGRAGDASTGVREKWPRRFAPAIDFPTPFDDSGAIRNSSALGGSETVRIIYLFREFARDNLTNVR